MLPVKPSFKIAEDIHKTEDIDKILLLADKMPLPINLIAHSADSEGILNVPGRWETQKTSIISEGYDAKSNLKAMMQNLTWSYQIHCPSLALG
jgi:hypothetical protein